jgi:hypothetical protein
VTWQTVAVLVSTVSTLALAVVTQRLVATCYFAGRVHEHELLSLAMTPTNDVTADDFTQLLAQQVHSIRLSKRQRRRYGVQEWDGIDRRAYFAHDDESEQT